MGTESAEGARFKGKLGISLRKALTLDFSPAARASLGSELSDDARRLFTERMVATAWYPLRGAEELIAAAARKLGQPPERYARRLGANVASEAAGPVGRTLVTLFATPARIARHMDSMWQQVYDSGHIAGSYDAERGTLIIDRTEWRGHQPLLCMTLLGSLEGIASQMRGEALVAGARAECISDGATRCRFELHFETR